MKLFAVIFIYFIVIVFAQDLTENEKYLLYKIEQLQKHFERNITDLDTKINLVEDNTNKKSNTCEKGWFSYLELKCIKIMEKKGTEAQAQTACQSLGNQANLLSIHSEHEEQHINNELSKYNNLADDVWIGLKFSEKAWKWTDNTALDYQNWDSDAKKDGLNPCVRMSITKSSLGKWKDESCDRQNLIVCQRKQTTITVFADDLKNLTKVVNEQQNTIIQQKAIIDKERADFSAQINQQKSELAQTKNQLTQANNRITSLEQHTIPVGFLYTQLPGQLAPAQIWPQYKWGDVTAQYAGQFFRAEGAGSSPFGQVQAEYSPRLAHVGWGSLVRPKAIGQIDIPTGQWSDYIETGVLGSHGQGDGIRFFINGGEVRPRNSAIKIWKRIG